MGFSNCASDNVSDFGGAFAGGAREGDSFGSLNLDPVPILVKHLETALAARMSLEIPVGF